VLAVSSVSIDGVALPLDNVAADITIRHGRGSYYDATTPSTAQVTLVGVTRAFVQAISLSRPLVIKYRVDGGPEKPRFTGRTTDAAVDGDQVTLIAVGRLSTLDSYTVGTAAYVAQGLRGRVSTVFNEAGLLAYLDYPLAGLAPNLNPRAVAPVSLAEYLDGLLAIGQAQATDAPDGTIRFDAGKSRDANSPTVIPGSDVEYVPGWAKVLPGANKAVIGYGTASPQATSTVADPAAATLYGERLFQANPSEISNKSDADILAQSVVSQQKDPRWTTPGLTLLHGYELRVGQALKISGLPAPAPYSVWTAFVEGWQDTISSDGEHVTWRMDVALSDTGLSGEVAHVVWSDLPATDHWDTINPTVTWANADNLRP